MSGGSESNSVGGDGHPFAPAVRARSGDAGTFGLWRACPGKPAARFDQNFSPTDALAPYSDHWWDVEPNPPTPIVKRRPKPMSKPALTS